MNIEIMKFRAWIGNKMVYWGFIDGTFISPPANLGQSENPFNVPQMQYTGRKDKNGNEIYDGDLLEFGDENKWFGKIVWNNEHTKFECVDVNTGGTWESWKYGEKPVVGNIYENPELIK